MCCFVSTVRSAGSWAYVSFQPVQGQSEILVGDVRGERRDRARPVLRPRTRGTSRGLWATTRRTWNSSLATYAFLESGVFKGRDAVGRTFADWFKTFEPGYYFEIEETRDLGDRVFLAATHRGRGRTSGAEVHGQTGYLYGVRSGKIAQVELYPSGAEALEAAGLEE